MEGRFEMSKKNQRSPTKLQNKKDAKLDLILEAIKDVKEEQMDLGNEGNQFREETNK